MLYAKITVKVFVDEDKLTKEQREQAQKADTDLTIDHPLDIGFDNLRATIERSGALGFQNFRYLGEGVKAVKIRLEE